MPAGVDTEVYPAWTAANNRDAIVPHLDWATPTMYDTITAEIQKLLARRTTPSRFVDAIQSDYSKFHKTVAEGSSHDVARRLAWRGARTPNSGTIGATRTQHRTAPRGRRHGRPS